MIVYHLDRAKKLSADMDITFTPSQLSSHGQQYWQSIPADSLQRINDVLMEHIFEEVRLAEYPDRPSRFHSMFACLDYNQIGQWGTILNVKADCPVWQIETPSVFVADAALLHCLVSADNPYTGQRTQQFDLSLCRTLARLYWQGASVTDALAALPPHKAALLATASPQPECLIWQNSKVIGPF